MWPIGGISIEIISEDGAGAGGRGLKLKEGGNEGAGLWGISESGSVFQVWRSTMTIQPPEKRNQIKTELLM